MESQATKETDEGMNTTDNSKRYSFEITQNEILKYMPDVKKSQPKSQSP
jgi:hypothetical protein